ncbi:outer membrane protein assembly factor [Palleronia sediminis]|uniref:Outer membrane protein assembly factor n=1 Tax=Palleronia sediminis TaxID=2547833 RepID=A0A4V6PP64_9RHOB|nr:outer membrane protein assembly factor [Palleronia sediminis]
MGSILRATAALCVLALPAQAFEKLYFEVAGGGELKDDLKSASLLVAAENEGVTDRAELLAAARADYARIAGALYAEGHFGGIVNILIDGREAANIPPLRPPPRIDTISVRVRPGPTFRFSALSIAPLAPRTELPEGFRTGQPARSGIVRDAARESIDAWRQVGYAKAEIADQTVIAQHDEDRLAVDIDLAPGPRVTFGNLILRGSDAVRPERLRAIAGLPTGEIYDPDEVEAAAKRLRRTQVFSSVAVTEAETLSPGDRLDIIAALSAFEPRRIGFGAEISTVDGLTLSGFWLHRNLLGGAERLRFEGEVSGLGGGTGGPDYKLGARFERPATFSAKNTLFLETTLERLDEPDYLSTVGFVGAGIQRIVNDEITFSYGLAYRFSRVEDDLGERDYSMLLAPLEGTFDNREEPLDATDGFYVNLGLQPFVGVNDQTGDGARLVYDARSYLSFGAEDRVTLAGRIQGGSIFGAELREVPNEFRFYSGGGGTVRGQDYQSLGVRMNGTETGGGSFVGVSAELRARVTEKIGVVAFADYGTVGFDSFPDSDSPDHAGAGLGARYLTPIGPIRLDVAAPIGGDGEGVEVYIGIGQAF